MGVALVAIVGVSAWAFRGWETEIAPETPGGSDGLWLMRLMTVDGVPFDLGEAPLFLTVADGRIVGGSGRCNGFGFDADGTYFSEAVGCFEERAVFDERLREALTTSELLDDRLVLSGQGTRVEYERFTEPTPGELFSVLAAPESAASPDEIVLDAEAGGTPDFDAVARLAALGGIDYFLATDGSLVCLVRSNGSTGGYRCQQARQAALITFADAIFGPDGPLGPTVALVPDAFLEAARSLGRGELVGNIWLLADEPNGTIQLTNDAGDEFAVTVVG